MYSKKAIIMCPIGLYGRSAASFIQLANRFKSTIFVEFEDKKANAKSLLGLLSLALVKGYEINIKAEGVDEKESVDSLVDYINAGCPREYENDDISDELSAGTSDDLSKNGR